MALAVSLNLRTYLRLQVTSSSEVSISLPNIDTFLCWNTSVLKPLLSHCTGRADHFTLFMICTDLYRDTALVYSLCVCVGVGECRSSTELDTELVRKLREFTAVSDGSTDTRSMAVLAFLYTYLCVFSQSE